MQPIKAVLFDFGGVFTDSPFGAAEKHASALGADPRRLLEIVFGPSDRDTDHPWHRLERGEISLENARLEIIALGEREDVDADPFKVFERIGTGGAARDAVVEKVREIRGAGYRTALVTNNVREFRSRWERLVPVAELFELVVDSSEVGVRKPDPAIFRIALERLGVDAERAVFLDDLAGNVDAASALGMKGVLVGPDPAPALDALDRLLSG